MENEFNYAHGNSQPRGQWQGEDVDLSSSSRHESQQPIPLLTNGQPVSDITDLDAFNWSLVYGFVYFMVFPEVWLCTFHPSHVSSHVKIGK